MSDARLLQELQAYTAGMGTTVQNVLTPVPKRIVDISSTAGADPISRKLDELRPSHLIRIQPSSSSSISGLPVGFTWRLELSDVSITRFAASQGKPSGTSVRTTPVYEVRAEGDASMGQILGNTLRAAQVLRIDSGS